VNVAIFGGTFDPIHHGHLAVARVVRQQFDLKTIYFVPADIPPHKQKSAFSPYHHRYAMVALATAGEKDFIPSLMEAPGEEALRAPSFSIETVRRFRQRLKRSDRLFFLIGIDAFLDIAKWREPEALLRDSEFIVAARPGYSLADVAKALPESLRPREEVTRPFAGQAARGDMVFGDVTLHLLPDTHENVSATQVRSAAAAGRGAQRWLPDSVAEYIRKTHLYKPGHGRSAAGSQAKTGLHVVARRRRGRHEDK